MIEAQGEGWFQQEKHKLTDKGVSFRFELLLQGLEGHDFLHVAVPVPQVFVLHLIGAAAGVEPMDF